MNLQHSSPHPVGPTAPPGGRIRFLPWFWGALAFAFVATLLIAAYLVFSSIRDYFTNLPFNQAEQVAMPAIATPEPGATPIPEIPRWTGHERVNVLLLGIDQREGEEGPWRTDTMMVLTLDPVTMSAGMLSIPRDTWVIIPGYDIPARINEAHYYGDLLEYPGGGPALARDAIEWNVGVPIHFYVRVNFTAFETMIDEIGGIDIDVPETIDDPFYPDEGYGYDPFYIEAGQQHLDGRTALKYARTRVTFGGDFDRGQRQQAVILAVRDRVLKLNQLPRLITKAPTLMDILGDAILTDMSLDQAIQLARLASDIDPEHIVSAVIDQNHTVAKETPDGAQVLMLNRESMRGLRDLIFSGPQEAGGEASAAERLVQENARIVVLNGSGIPGLAGRTRDHLSTQGFQVISVGDASVLYDYTLIVDYADKPFTSKELASALNLSLSSIVSGDGPLGDRDLELVLGADFELPEE